MRIYWMKTADVYPNARYDETAFMAFDPGVRFPAFHMEEGDETIGNVHQIEGGPRAGLWQWSTTVPGPAYGSSTNGVDATRGAAGRRVIEVYQHYLSTLPEKFLRS